MRWSLDHLAGHTMMVRRTGSGPELVWIHGLGDQSQGFDALVADPSLTGFSHVLVDLPGYGRSPWPERPDDLDQLAARLAGWIADRRPVVIGHSMGGVLATLIAERVAVRAVVDIEGNLSRGDCNFSAKAAAYTLDDFVSHGLSAMRAAVYDDGRTDTILRGYHTGMAMASPYAFHRHAVDLVAKSETEDLARRLAAVRVPVLYVAGVPDGICARSRELLDENGIRWVGLGPAAHWVHLDQHARFAAELAGFLGGL